MKKKSKKSVQPKSKSGQVINEAITDGLFNDSMAYAIHPHTEPCVSLKIFDANSAYIPIGAKRRGTLIHDAPGHYDFIAQSLERKLLKRASKSEYLRLGVFVNVKRNRDGLIYPTLRFGRLYSGEITFKQFCVAAARELLEFADLIKSHE